MAYPGAKILQLDQTGMHEVAYEDTEHFVVTRNFRGDREAMLKELLGND